MKAKIFVLLLMLAFVGAWLNIGFYKTCFAEDNRVVFFIKRHPAFQVRFENIFLTDEDPKRLDQLSAEERRLVIDYCKYRLGIETGLETQGDLEACKQQ